MRAGGATRGAVGFVSKTAREDQVLLIGSIMPVALAAVNAVFTTRATVQDSRHASAVTRALGVEPGQLTPVFLRHKCFRPSLERSSAFQEASPSSQLLKAT